MLPGPALPPVGAARGSQGSPPPQLVFLCCRAIAGNQPACAKPLALFPLAQYQPISSVCQPDVPKGERDPACQGLTLGDSLHPCPPQQACLPIHAPPPPPCPPICRSAMRAQLLRSAPASSTYPFSFLHQVGTRTPRLIRGSRVRISRGCLSA